MNKASARRTQKIKNVIFLTQAAMLLILLSRMTIMAQTISDFRQNLPRAVDDWKKTDQDSIFTPENLSKYIDGGAELFISYNFKSALSLKYAKDETNEISVDIFEMGASQDAFGVFAHSRETIDTRVGQGCEYAAGLLTFWKDRYYVSVLAYPETEEKKKVVFKLAEAIAREIKSEGPLPSILASLPQENLIPESVRYFHHYIWLNSFYFVSNENVLNIGHDTPAAFGKYRQGSSPYFLLLVGYPDDDKARAAHGQFLQKQLAGSPEGIRQMKDGRWTACRRQGSLFSAVFNAPDEQTARSLLARIKK